MAETFIGFDGEKWTVEDCTDYVAPRNTWSFRVYAKRLGPVPNIVTSTVDIPGWPLESERATKFVRAIVAATKELLSE